MTPKEDRNLKWLPRGGVMCRDMFGKRVLFHTWRYSGEQSRHRLVRLFCLYAAEKIEAEKECIVCGKRKWVHWSYA